MPAFAAMTINDGQGTPVAHTFNPIKIDNNGVALHQDQSGGVPIGYLSYSVSLRSPAAPRNGDVSSANVRVYRVMITCDKPVLETLGTSGSGYTPPPTVAYVARAKSEFIFPERSVTQDRKDIRAYLYNSLNLTYVKSVVEDLQAIW